MPIPFGQARAFKTTAHTSASTFFTNYAFTKYVTTNYAATNYATTNYATTNYATTNFSTTNFATTNYATTNATNRYAAVTKTQGSSNILDTAVNANALDIVLNYAMKIILLFILCSISFIIFKVTLWWRKKSSQTTRIDQQPKIPLEISPNLKPTEPDYVSIPLSLDCPDILTAVTPSAPPEPISKTPSIVPIAVPTEKFHSSHSLITVYVDQKPEVKKSDTTLFQC